MTLVSAAIPNFISGISQQAPNIRLASQAQDQLNGWPTVDTGLDKRPGTETIARLIAGTVPDDVFLHVINRDMAERYNVTIFGGDLKVHSLDGAERVVNFPNGKGYLSGTSFSAVSVADYTFVVNRTVPVALSPDVVASPAPGISMIAIRGVVAGTGYFLNLVQGSTVIEAGYEAKANDGTLDVAAALSGKINAAGGYTAYTMGNTIVVSRPDAQAFRITSADSYADQYINAINGTVQTVADLPLRAPDGLVVEVVGGAGTGADNFFIAFDSDGINGASGVWREVAAPGRKFRFDAATMPHLLVREADGSFTFRQAEWAECKAGDEDVCPSPGLVGIPISDVFFYRNRFGLIGGEQILMSRDGEFFNFWRRSASGLVDTDPIDVSVSHVKVSNLKRAVPFNETLMLFSEQTQFVIPPLDVLTPKTVSVLQTSEFEADLNCRPLGLGTSVFFAAFRGGYTAVREAFITGNTRKIGANDTTAHVPRLIRGAIRDMATSSTETALVVTTKENPREVGLFRFMDQNSQRMFSGWSRWRFAEGDRVLALEFISSMLFLVIARADGLYLERMDLSPGLTTGTLPVFPKLDRMVPASFNGGVTAGVPSYQLQRVAFPFPVTGTVQAVLTSDTGGRRAGEIFTSAVPGFVDLPASVDLTKVVMGLVYEMRHEFSPFFIRQAAPGGGEMTVNDGRLQVSSVTVSYVDSAYFRAEITPFQRQTFTRAFTGKVLGSAQNLLGSLPLKRGSFTFSVRCDSKAVSVALVNDTPWPSRVLSAEWAGLYTARTRRL